MRLISVESWSPALSRLAWLQPDLPRRGWIFWRSMASLSSRHIQFAQATCRRGRYCTVLVWNRMRDGLSGKFGITYSPKIQVQTGEPQRMSSEKSLSSSHPAQPLGLSVSAAIAWANCTSGAAITSFDRTLHVPGGCVYAELWHELRTWAERFPSARTQILW